MAPSLPDPADERPLRARRIVGDAYEENAREESASRRVVATFT